MTYQTQRRMYAKRVKYMEEVVKQGIKLDLYGRPSERFEENETLMKVYKGQLGIKNFNALKGEHFLGKETVGEYHYSLEFDVGPTRNYISERFYDAMLLWTKPIYFGSRNVHDILPEGSFEYIDIHKF